MNPEIDALFSLAAETPTGRVYAVLTTEGSIEATPIEARRGKFPANLALAIAFQEEAGLKWIVVPEATKND